VSELFVGDVVGYSDVFLSHHKEWQARELRPKRATVKALVDEKDLLTLHWEGDRSPSKCHVENVQVVRPERPTWHWRVMNED